MMRSHSLQGQLTRWMAAAVLVVSVLAATLAYSLALREAHDLQDGHLREVARLAASLLTHTPDLPSLERLDLDPEDLVVVEVRPQAPGQSTTASPDAALTSPLQPLLIDGRAWHAIRQPLPQGRELVVRQTTEARDEIARHSALMAMLPLLGLMPVLVWLVRLVVRRTLQPVQQLAQQIDQEGAEQPLSLEVDTAPDEIRPFVHAVRQWMDRVRQHQARQRRFIADAAHELRTPVAALSIQAENLAHAEMNASARERLAPLQAGLGRTRHLLDQLLSLSRQQEAVHTPHAEHTPCLPALQEVMAQLHPLAHARGVELALLTPAEATLPCSAFELQTLLRNVLSNAIHHSPAGGCVQVAWEVGPSGQATQLVVDDDGPGIEPSQAQRVFEPFYKAPGPAPQGHEGTGLGLSIVQAIAQGMQAHASLGPRPDGHQGCRFSLTAGAPRSA